MKSLLKKAIHALRDPIYKVGLRPKRGSIFFSPSRDLSLKFSKALKATKHNPWLPKK